MFHGLQHHANLGLEQTLELRLYYTAVSSDFSIEVARILIEAGTEISPALGETLIPASWPAMLAQLYHEHVPPRLT